MPRGNQRRNQRIRTRYDAQNSGSDCESSDSEELPNVNDKDIQKYFEIRPTDIFGRQEPAKVKLRKSLVQRHFRSLKQFTSSTPARVGPGPFNESSVISPILHRNPLATFSPPKAASEVPEKPSRQRENDGVKDVMQKSPQKNTYSNLKKDLSRELSSESESSGVRKKSSTQRLNGGLKSATTNETTQKKTRRRSFATQFQRDESTSESELPDVFKRSSATQTATRRRISQKLKRAELHRSLPDKKRSKVRDESSSDSQLESHKRLRNKTRNGILKVAKQFENSMKQRAQVLSDCERGDESSSESESTLKGHDVQRYGRTSQKPATHMGFSDKNNPDCARSNGSSSESSEATLKGADLQRNSSQKLKSTNRNFSGKMRERSQVPPDNERRQDSSLESASMERSGIQKIVTTRTPKDPEKTGFTHRSFVDEKREPSQVLRDYERRQETSLESQATVKRSDVQKIVTERGPEQMETTGPSHRNFKDKNRERGYERSWSETTIKRPDVHKVVTVTKRISENLERAGSTRRSFADKKREHSQVLSDHESCQGSSSEAETTLKGPRMRNLEKTGSTHRSFSNKTTERSRVLPDYKRDHDSPSKSEKTMKHPDVQAKRIPTNLQKTGSTHRSFTNEKRERSQVLPDYEIRQESSLKSILKRPDIQEIVTKRTPKNLEKTESTRRNFTDDKRERERSQIMPDCESRGESSSKKRERSQILPDNATPQEFFSKTTLKRPGIQEIVTKRTPERLERTGSTHRSFTDEKRERSQILPDHESRGEPEAISKDPVLQKKRQISSLKISGISQRLGTPAANTHALVRSSRRHSQFIPASEMWQDESPENTAPDTLKSLQVSKEWSIRANAQVLSDRKRQGESSESEKSDVDERQHLTYRNTSEKQRNPPASPQRRRGIIETNDTAYLLKHGRVQASADEPILTKSRCRRSRSSVRSNEEPEDVSLSNRREDVSLSNRREDVSLSNRREDVSLSNRREDVSLLSNKRDDVRGSTTTAGSNAKDHLILRSEPDRDVQRISRKGAEKDASSGEDDERNKRKKRGTPLTVQKEKDGGIRDAKKRSLVDNRMKDIYKNNFYMSSQSDYNMSYRSDSDYSRINKIHSKVNPTATGSSLSEKSDVSVGLNRLNSPHISASDFIRKANNINRVITNLMSSKKESVPLSRCEEVGDSLPFESEDNAAEVESRPKIARNKLQDKENIAPPRKTTGKRKAATKKKKPPENKSAIAKVQKGGAVEASDSNSEASTGLRRSKRERKPRDLGVPDVFIYVDEKNKPIVSKPEKKKKDKNKNNTRKQLSAVSVKTMSTRHRKHDSVEEPLPGCSGQTNEPRRTDPGGVAGGELESGYECEGRNGDDFFDVDEFSSLGLSEGEHRRKTRHLNMRINNSLYKIEWFNDGKQTLLDLESDTSNTNDSNDTHVMHSIDVPSVATSGYIVIGPSGSKPPQLSRKYSLMFYVIEGTANVSVQDRFYIGGPSCNFFIPFGFEYTIRNLSASKKLTLFCVRIPS